MITRDDLQGYIVEALRANGGKASLLDVCKYVWKNHENELKENENLLYTWQYDIRWAATILRKKNILKASEDSPKGIWELL